MPLGMKDLKLAEMVAAETGLVLPTGAALRRVFEIALADPSLATLDWGAAAEVTRRDLYPAPEATAETQPADRS